VAGLKVSVVVPVYNPGPDIDDCIRTLLGQTMADDEYELIFVDDGSTDETPALLDRLAAEHANVHVRHEENSGWSGRPRNLGMEMAQGEFLYFVDNDDWLGEEALERLYAMAKADDADIVVGKVVGHGKSVPRNLFRRNRSGVDIEWEPLLWLLTPHKLFRRAFVEAHGIRFPEGRRRLEDHIFVMQAYFRQPRISVLADYPCYHWVLRDSGTNASFGRLDPASYFADMGEVLDIVDANVPPGALRDRLYSRWYRGKMLQRVVAVLSNADPVRRQALYEEMHDVAVERFPESVDALLPFNLQLRSRLLRAGAYDALANLAQLERTLKVGTGDIDVRSEGKAARLRLTAWLESEDGPLAFRRQNGAVTWVAPATVEGSAADGLDAAPALEKSVVQVLLKRLATQEEYRVPAELERRLEQGPDGQLVPRLRVDAKIDAATGAAGAPLEPGSWAVFVMVIVGGFRMAGRVHDAPGTELLSLTVHGDGRVTTRAPRWRRRLRRRVPRPVLRAARRTQRAVRRARRR